MQETAVINRNKLFAAIPRTSLRRLLKDAEFTSINARETVQAPGSPLERVYFPIEGMVSLAVLLEDGRSSEVGVVGREGLVGHSLLFGEGRTMTLAVSRTPVYAVALPYRSFRREMSEGAAFAKVLQSYANAFLNATSMAAACASAHNVEQRCAGWLLMGQGRLDTDSFPLTHDEFARALGVRRATVSAAATKLQRTGVIVFTRGLVMVRDRRRLEEFACGCFRRIRSAYGASIAGAW